MEKVIECLFNFIQRKYLIYFKLELIAGQNVSIVIFILHIHTHATHTTHTNENILFSMKYSLRETFNDRNLFERESLDRAVESRNRLVFPFVLDTRYITMTLREHAFTSGAKNL